MSRFRALYGPKLTDVLMDYLVSLLRDDYDHSCLVAESFQNCTEREKAFVYDIVSHMKEELGEGGVELGGELIPRSVWNNPIALYGLVVKAKHSIAAFPIPEQAPEAAPVLLWETTQFDHICAKIMAMPRHRELAEFIEDEGMNALRQRWTRDAFQAHQVLAHEDGSLKIRDIEALASLPLARYVNQPGWYLAVMKDAADPAWLRLYVGQAIVISVRIVGHQARKRAGGHELFYRLWNMPGRSVQFYILATTDSIEPDWLNLGKLKVCCPVPGCRC